MQRWRLKLHSLEYSVEPAVETALHAQDDQMDTNLSQLRNALAELSAALGIEEQSDEPMRAAS
jgi:hypothetical protein